MLTIKMAAPQQNFWTFPPLPSGNYGGVPFQPARLPLPTQLKPPSSNYQANKRPPSAHKSHEHVNNIPRLPSLETPEEIAAWIAERKSRWPTLANVQKKSETLPTDQSSRGGRGRGRGRGSERGRGRGRGSKRFAEGHESSERQEFSKRQRQDTPNTSASQAETNALSLLSAYGSDNDEEDEEEGAINIDKPAQVDSKDPKQESEGHSQSTSSQVCKYYLRGTCKRGRSCHFQHTRPPKRTSSKEKRGGGHRDNTSEKTARPSLLEKLTEQDKFQNKSQVLLQCIKYIVAQRFFQDFQVKKIDNV